jgi:nicotinic acid mononucleotide adenylyltransferase
MLDVFELRVAARRGAYRAPAELSGRIRALEVDCPLDDISATSVRERMARGEPWESLVPPGVAPLARHAYGLR